MTGFGERPAATRGALGPEAREAALAALKASTEPGKELDILIVGGGIVGTGVALDAVTRGLTSASWKPATGPPGPHPGPPSSSTAASVTWRCSTSPW